MILSRLLRRDTEKGENDEFLKPIIVGGKEARVKGELKTSSVQETTHKVRS